MAGVLKHKFQTTKADGPDSTRVQGTKWNEEHAFAGSVLGALLVRDTNETDGAAWLSPSVGFLYSDGDGIPVYRALVANDIPQIAYSSLSGLPSLGGAASLSVGTSAGTVAAGDHVQAATVGGTGLTTYAVGDILHAPTTNTIGRLAAVAAGAVLVSAGANTVPAWSASPTITNVLITTDLYSSTDAVATIGAGGRFKSARIGGNTVTTSQPVLDLAQRWNASGVSFKGISLVVTEDAAHANARYFEIVGGAAGSADQFYVLKGGTVVAAADFNTPGGSFVTSATLNRGLFFGSVASGNGIGYRGANKIGLYDAGTLRAVIATAASAVTITGASETDNALLTINRITTTGAIAIGNTVQAAVAVASTHKVTFVVGGSTYYFLATNF